jgi:hypothetical protein
VFEFPVRALRSASRLHFNHGGKSALADCGFTFAGQRSRSNDPMALFCTEEFLICFAAVVLIFFIRTPSWRCAQKGG